MEAVFFYAPQQRGGGIPTRARAAHKLWSAEPGAALEGALRTSGLKAAHIGADSPRCWVHLCLYGAWKGHSAGEFEFSREVFDQLIANFDSLANPVPWTIGHPDGATPAPGYVLQLAIKGDGTGEHDGLYALTEWTAKTATEIREGGWRFCSVYVDFESIDRKSNEPIGCELIQVGLTNNPFLDGQKPITLSRLGAQEPRTMKPEQIIHAFVALAGLVKGVKLDTAADMEKEIAAVAKLLGMPKGADIGKIIAQLNAMQAYLKSRTSGEAPADAGAAMSSADAAKYAASWKRLSDAKLEGPDAPAPDATGGGDGTDDEAKEGALLDVIKSIQAKTGLDDTAFKAAVDQNADAIASLLQGGGVPMTDTMPAPMERKFAALSAELKASTSRADTLASELEALKAAEAKRNADAVQLAAERKVAEEAAAKLDEETKARRAVAEREAETAALINAAISDGRLLLAVATVNGELVKVEAGSEVEHAREYFKLDHDKAKAWLAGKKRIVPVPGSVALSHPVPPPPVRLGEVEEAEIDLDEDKLDETERYILANNRGNLALARRVIAGWREKKAAFDAAK